MTAGLESSVEPEPEPHTIGHRYPQGAGRPDNSFPQQSRIERRAGLPVAGQERRAEGEAELKRLLSWQPTFAWFPVEVGNGACVWLERVERRYSGAYLPDYDNVARTGLWVEYRLPPGRAR